MTSDNATPDNGSGPQVPPDAIMRNEFSLVELRYIRRGDSVSLLVHDSMTGAEILLDSTELECLARAPHESFRRLLREVDDQTDGALQQVDAPARTSNGQGSHGNH